MKSTKTARQKAVKAADIAFSLYIRARDRYVCQTFGCSHSAVGGYAMQCGHLFTRTNFSTRWDENNAKCQCSGCNMRHEYDAYPFMKTFLDEHGQEWVDRLHRKFAKVTKYKTFEIVEIAAYYREKTKSLQEFY